jgi:hypothetical protein
MLNEAHLIEFCQSLMACWKRDQDAAFDVIGRLDGLLTAKEQGDGLVAETARTILTLLEPKGGQ